MSSGNVRLSGGNKIGMPPTVTCLVAVGVVLAAETREGGEATSWPWMEEAQKNPPTGHLTRRSSHFLICNREGRVTFRQPGAPVGQVLLKY